MQPARIRRVLGRLRDPATRGETLRRIRQRVASRVAGAPLGATPGPAAGGAADEARRQRLEAGFAQAIARGESLEAAVVGAVTALAETGDWHDWNAGWALAEGAAGLPAGESASALGHAVLEHRRRHFDRVWRALEPLPDATLARHAPVEAVDGALAAGTPAGRERALAIARPSADMAAPVAIDLAGRLLAFGERQAAAALVAELRGRPAVDLDPRRRRSWQLIEGWLDQRPTAVPAGSVPIGVLTYRTPDHVLTSGNLGDLIQSLAFVGNIVRYAGASFSGDAGLGALATELQGRVRPELRLEGPRGAAHLVPVDRDFSSAADVPEGTWLVAFGWHMHPLYDLRYDFPYHPNVRPLFVSFHVNRLDMLTDEALAYLRRHAPIGCRDWNTTFLLLSAGIEAFFSGCMTTTIDGLFPARQVAYRGNGEVAIIDLPNEAAGRRSVRISHQSDEYRSLPLTDGLRAADTALARYQRDVARAITGRLHAYLPLTALGVPVDFRTGSPGDVRFAGLTGLRPGDARLEAIRGGIRALLGPTLAKVLAGAPPDEVYGLWRERTAPLVAEARARFEAPVHEPATTVDVGAAVATSLAGGRRSGPHESVDPATVADVALSFDQNLTLPAAVLIESIVANASAPVRVWILGRGLSEAYVAWLGTAFPAVPITVLPCDHVGYGPTGRPRRVPSRITVSTMDRLLLPGLLPDVPRVAYLDVDTLMLGDVRALVTSDLGGHPIAARDSNVSEASEWQRAGRRLPEPEATELRRRMGLGHGFGHPALNAGVIVMDLDRMRRDGFMAWSLGIVEAYGLHDQDTMLAYVGPGRGRLDGRWNAMPVLEDVTDPSLIHWASFGKPWDPPVTYGKSLWQSYATRLHDRAGPPPTGNGPSGPPGSLGNPLPLGPAVAPAPARVEATIAAIGQEHLSYLDAASLRTLAACVAEVDEAGIAGLIVEAGTARGGSAIVMAAAKATARRMRAHDVFGMIPPPGERDGADVHRRYATIAAGRSKGLGGETYYGYRDDLLGEVRASFERHGLPLEANGIELVQGRFEDTIQLDEPVALAHLDGDWYASTMTCLARIVPRLAVGGRIVIDDYDTWSGCRAAVNEFFAGRRGFRFERRGRLHAVRVGPD